MRAMVGDGLTAGGPLQRKLLGFGPLQEADKAILALIAAGARSVPAGTDLVREGDRADGMFVIVDGFACRYKLRETGARQIIAYLLPGDLCDPEATTLGRMDHAVGTLSACSVARVAPETARDLLRHPALTEALRHTALAEAAIVREWLVNIGRRSAVERLAHLFCELFVRLRMVGLTSGDGYELPITQLDLADTTGMTSVHVNRSLGELKRQGLIERKGKRLILCDLPRLIEVAEFRPDYLPQGNRTGA